MAKVSYKLTRKQFRKRVKHHIQEVEDSVGFLTDKQWLMLILSKLTELSETRHVNTDTLALLGALIEVWGTDRGMDND